MNNTFAYQVLNDFNLMNKIVKQKQNICCEIGKKVITNFDYYNKQRNELLVKCIEEYFKTEVTPKIRALSWKNIHRVQLYVNDCYGDVGCEVWKNYDQIDQWSESGFCSYKEYKTMLDRTISEMKKDIDENNFDINEPDYGKAHYGFEDTDKEYQIRMYSIFKKFNFDFNADITIIKKFRPLKEVNRRFSIDLDL